MNNIQKYKNELEQSVFEISLHRFRDLINHLDIVEEWKQLKLNQNRTQEDNTQKNFLSRQLEALLLEYVENKTIPKNKYYSDKYEYIKLKLRLKNKYNIQKNINISSHDTGYCSEQIAYHKLQCTGHSPILMPKHWAYYDLVAYFDGEWKKVQVKTINHSKHGIHLKTGSGLILHHEILICVCKKTGKTYLLNDIKQSRITIGENTNRKSWGDEIKINPSDFLPFNHDLNHISKETLLKKIK